jgi:hypothetical protein
MSSVCSEPIRKGKVTLENLSLENVWELSEKDVSTMLSRLISDYPKDRRPYFTEMLSLAFEFRSISANSNELKDKMTRSGYKFFPIPYNTKLIMAIKKADMP